MKTAIISIAIIIVVAVLIYLCYKSIRKNLVKLNAPENFVTEESPIESIEAEIVDKQVSLVKTRPDTILPEHRIDYLVSFRLIDGTRKTLRIDKEIYDRISISEVGEVVIQNNVVFDFIQKNGNEEEFQ